MKKAIVRPLPEEHESNYEVYVPAKLSTSGEKVRKRFKLKKEANAYADELNIKIEGDAVAPLGHEYHIVTAKYQSKLTAVQFEQALALMVEQIDQNNITLAELFERYVEMQQRRHKRGQIRDRRFEDIQKQTKKLKEWLGNPLVRSITEEMVEEFIDERLDAGASKRTVFNYGATLRHVFKWGLTKGFLTINPMKNVTLPSKKSEVKIMTPSGLETLLQHSTHFPRVYIMFGAFGGLRSNEINLTSWENVNLDENHVFVPGKKNVHAERIVELTPPLRAYCELMLNSDNPPEGLLMDINDSTFRNHLNKMYEAAGGLRIPQNALRHSYASHHLVAYKDPTLTATEMGHTSPTTTFAFYRRAVKKTQALLYWNIRWVPAEGEDLMAVAA